MFFSLWIRFLQFKIYNKNNNRRKIIVAVDELRIDDHTKLNIIKINTICTSLKWRRKSTNLHAPTNDCFVGNEEENFRNSFIPTIFSPQLRLFHLCLYITIKKWRSWMFHFFSHLFYCEYDDDYKKVLLYCLLFFLWERLARVLMLTTTFVKSYIYYKLYFMSLWN